jgi:lipooligosaccharide transport system permease protein
MSLSPHLPRFSWRCLSVWQRNFLVWKKLALPAILGNLADPMIYLFGLGYGLGSLLPDVGGVSYIVFLGAGTVCSSTMNAASFEALYSGFSRMHVQKTWEAILNAPLSLDDILVGEWLWAGSKAMLSGVAILLVIAALGLIPSWLALWALPVILLTGMVFAAFGLIVTALAQSYDFFMYYFTLFITPMTLLCGVFYPIEQLPELLQPIANALPLAHAVQLVRPLLLGEVPHNITGHVLALLLSAISAYWIALLLVRRRLLS